MKFKLQILCLQLLQQEFEIKIKELGKIDCSNENKYLELNDERNKCIDSIIILKAL